MLDAAAEHGVERLLFLGSSCIYPRLAPQPIREDALLTGPLEPTNDAYAIAKIAGILQAQALRRQYGRHYISAMPTNLYGPGDNFDLATQPRAAGHDPPLPRGEAAAVPPSVTLWGTGTPRREFLHVDDLARACLFLLENYDEPEHINVGVGEDLTIRELAETVASIVGLRRRDRVGHDQARRHAAQAARRLPDQRAGLEGRRSVSTRASAATYDWYVSRLEKV